jgi:2,5-diketo-D-gluconate reductase A
VYDAIRMGYRHIDTSQAYGNEGDIGRAIKRAIDEGIVTRNDLFISTKISFQKDSGRNVFNLVHMQLEKLKLNYIDLYMIHSHMASDTILKATWHSITQMYYDGIIRAAGVSNFNAQQLERLVDMVMKSREDEEGVDGGAQGMSL